MLLAATASYACVCNVRSISKRVRESRSVFVGTIDNRTQVSENGLWRNEFTVERYWKGVADATLIVYTTSDDCAPSFEVGGKYLVLAYFVKDAAHLETEVCMGTGRADMATDDLAKLGKGKLVAKRNAHSLLRRNPTQIRWTRGSIACFSTCSVDFIGSCWRSPASTPPLGPL